MKYYKVIKDNRVIDVLDKIVYLKYQPKHKTMILSDENDAQAILSSDQNYVWHEKSLYNIPENAHRYETVELVEIDIFEYRKLRMLNMCTPEEIIDNFVLNLLESNVI